MKEIYEMILQEKLKENSNKKFIQWLQKLTKNKLKRILINQYKKYEY
jgi:hypothetical protein